MISRSQRPLPSTRRSAAHAPAEPGQRPRAPPTGTASAAHDQATRGRVRRPAPARRTRRHRHAQGEQPAGRPERADAEQGERRHGPDHPDARQPDRPRPRSTNAGAGGRDAARRAASPGRAGSPSGTAAAVAATAPAEAIAAPLARLDRRRPVPVGEDRPAHDRRPVAAAGPAWSRRRAVRPDARRAGRAAAHRGRDAGRSPARPSAASGVGDRHGPCFTRSTLGCHRILQDRKWSRQRRGQRHPDAAARPRSRARRSCRRAARPPSARWPGRGRCRRRWPGPPRVKRSNTRSRSAGGMPGPSSLTSMAQPPPGPASAHDRHRAVRPGCAGRRCPAGSTSTWCSRSRSA